MTKTEFNGTILDKSFQDDDIVKISNDDDGKSSYYAGGKDVATTFREGAKVTVTLLTGYDGNNPPIVIDVKIPV